MLNKQIPKWQKAPKRANYLAQDRCGKWYWYIDKPIIDHNVNSWYSEWNIYAGQSQSIGDCWITSLQKNPNMMETTV